MKRLLLAPAIAVASLALATPAFAQFGWPDWNRRSRSDGWQSSESRRIAYEQGYREGLREGENDGRRRDAFDYQDERTWQRADKGYDRSFGDRERYRQTFRSAYAAGYRDGYERFAPAYGPYGGGSGRAIPRGSRVPYPSYPGVPSRRPSYEYPGQYPGRYGYGYSAAHANGLNDGYEKGLEDARDRDPYDPARHKWYRSGDHDYKSEYGPKEQYRDLYREGFREGYDRGYREARFR
jgi:hypothetical protein